jgi:heme exporter protein CcmD
MAGAGTTRSTAVLGWALMALGVILGLGAIAFGFRYHLNPTYAPQGASPGGAEVRYEGMVEPGSIQALDATGVGTLRIAGASGGVQVRFQGALPAFVREGRSLLVIGEVAEGGVLVAQRLANPHLFFVALSYGIAALVLLALAGGSLLLQRRAQAEVERFVLRSRRS